MKLTWYPSYETDRARSGDYELALEAPFGVVACVLTYKGDLIGSFTSVMEAERAAAVHASKGL